ncbi:MAG: SET domain-containing protein-lysine N-methyltransferase [Chthoniobacterales bacterium]|nr:SET domain-containing protein-lysine N-methyltransferase [Chthoniobacterales bacterium]
MAYALPQLVVRKSGINGKGCFAAVPLAARRKIGELAGERISNAEARRRVAKGGKLRICEIDDRWSIDASRGGNATAYINHSCAPNCFSRVTRGHMLFLSLRDIAAGEEITLDYTPSQHPGRPCTCGAANCRGVML